MKIIGHPWIQSERFIRVDSVEAIRKSPASSVLYFEILLASVDLITYCRNEGLPFAVSVTDIKTAILAHGMGARYLVCGTDIVQKIQNVAQQYLFDTEILIPISSEDEIEVYAAMGIDGAIFPSAFR